MTFPPPPTHTAASISPSSGAREWLRAARVSHLAAELEMEARGGSVSVCCKWCDEGRPCARREPPPNLIEAFGAVENYGAEWPY